MYHYTQRYFREPYAESSIEVRKKMRFMTDVCLLVLCAFAIIIPVRVLLEDSGWHIYAGDAVVVIAVILSLFFVRWKMPIAAGNCFFALLATIFFHQIIGEYYNNGVQQTTILYGSLTGMITGIIFFSLIAIDSRQIISFALAASVVLIWHFFVIVSLSPRGGAATADWQVLLAVLMLNSFAGLFCYMLFTIYKKHLTAIEGAIQESQEKYYTLFMHIDDSFAFCQASAGQTKPSEDFIYVEVNPSFEKLVGLHRRELVGKSYSVLKDQMHLRIDQHIPHLLTLDTSHPNYQAVQEDASRQRWLMLYAYCPIKDYFVTFFRDITSIKQRQAHLKAKKNEIAELNQELQKLSSIDPLTRIANRRAFDFALIRRYGQAVTEGVSISLLMIDVDHFKDYNDTHGHLSGDHCLQVVAQTLQQSLFRTSDLICRYGGEEFCALLYDTNRAEASIVAERLRSQAAMAFTRITQAITISIGLSSTHAPEQQSPNELLRQADMALYQAKANGRNRVEIWQQEQG